jgi:hydrogenase expression/formation protein HypE
VVNNDITESFLTVIKTFDYGKEASIIGEVMAEHPGKVFMKSTIGGRRVVGMMAGEQLPRIC